MKLSHRWFYIFPALILLIVMVWMMSSGPPSASVRPIPNSHPSKVASTTIPTLQAQFDEADAPPVRRPKRPATTSKPPVSEVDPRDEQLREDGPEVATVRVHTLLPAGHSMVLGGYATADGNHEFAVVTPEWLTGPNGEKQLRAETKIVSASDKGLEHTGLSSLVTNERKSQQNAEVWTAEDMKETFAHPEGIDVLSAPGLIMPLGAPGQIRIGSADENGALFDLQMSVSEGPNGEFDMKVEMKKIDPR